MHVARLHHDEDSRHAERFLRERRVRWKPPRDDLVRTYVMHRGGPASDVVGLAQVRIGKKTFVLLTLEMHPHARRLRAALLSRVLLHLLDEFRGRRALVTRCGRSKKKRRMIKSCGRFEPIGAPVGGGAEVLPNGDAGLYEWELPAVPPPTAWPVDDRADLLSGVLSSFTAYDPGTRRMFASGTALVNSGAAYPVLTLRTFDFTRDGPEIDGVAAEVWQEALRIPLRRDASGVPMLQSDPPRPALEREGDYVLAPPRRFLSIRLRVLGSWLNQRARKRGALSQRLEVRDIELQFTNGIEFAAAWRVFVTWSGWMEAGLVRRMEQLPSDVSWTSCPVFSLRLNEKPWDVLRGRPGTVWFGDYADARDAIYAYIFSAKGRVLAAIPDIQRSEMWEAKTETEGRRGLRVRTQGRDIEFVTDAQCVERVGRVFQ